MHKSSNILKELKTFLFIYGFLFGLIAIGNYIADKVLFNNTYGYLLVLYISVGFRLLSFLYLKQINCTNAKMTLKYFPNFNRNVTINFKDIQRLEIVNSYVFTNVRLEHTDRRLLKFSSMDISIKEMNKIKYLFENSDIFKTDYNLGKWKAYRKSTTAQHTI